MTSTRVLLAGLPAMLRDVLVRGLAPEHRVAVTVVPRLREVEEAVRRQGVDAVVFCTSDGSLPSGGRRLLRRFPRLRVVVLTTDGRQASRYRLVFRRTRWTDVALRDVLAALGVAEGGADG